MILNVMKNTRKHELPFPIKTIVLDDQGPSRKGVKKFFCIKTGLYSEAIADFLIKLCAEFGSSFDGKIYSKNFIKNLDLAKLVRSEVKCQLTVLHDSHYSVMSDEGKTADPSEVVFFDQKHEVCMAITQALGNMLPIMNKNERAKFLLADTIQDLIELSVKYERLIGQLSVLDYGDEGVAEFGAVLVSLTSHGKRKKEAGIRLSYEDFRFMDRTEKQPRPIFLYSPKNLFKELSVKNCELEPKDLEDVEFLETGYSAKEAFLISLLLLGMEKRRLIRLYQYSEAEIDEFRGTQSDPLSQNIYAARLEELKKKKDKLETDEASEAEQFMKQAEDEFKKLQKRLAIKFKALHDKKQAELDEFFEKTVKESRVEYAFNRSLKMPEVKVGCEQMTERDLIKLAKPAENENRC